MNFAAAKAFRSNKASKVSAPKRSIAAPRQTDEICGVEGAGPVAGNTKVVGGEETGVHQV